MNTELQLDITYVVNNNYCFIYYKVNITPYCYDFNKTTN